MDTLNGFPLYDFVIDQNDPIDGVSVISFVDKPAVEKTFLALSKDKVQIKLAFNEEKHIVTGCALRANFPIYRDQDNEKFYFQIKPDEIEKMVQKFMKEDRNSKVNIQHTDGMEEVEGVWLIESFIMNDSHRVAYPEFEDIEDGSWMVSYKVENDAIWESIKEGKLNGFSAEIEGTRIQVDEDESDILDIINLLTLIEK